MSQTVYTQCIVCDKPLGSQTRDAFLMLCHDCRKCRACQHPLGAREILNVWDEYGDMPKEEFAKNIMHPRCALPTKPNGDQDPSVLVKQSYIDFLNLFRFVPDPELSPETNAKMAGLQSEKYLHELPFDSRYTYLCMLESAVASVSIAIKTDKKVMKLAADKREAEKFQKAAAQARVSSRAANKPETDEKEIILGAFMAENGFTDRSHAQKLLRDRSKAIQGLVALGIAEKQATEAIDKQMRERGQIK